MNPLLTTALPLPIFRKGKVRDVYDLGEHLLIVATDRISAFDCIMPNGIPDKGKILTSVTSFWFDQTQDIIPHHVRSQNFNDFPSVLKSLRSLLEGRTMKVQKTTPIPIECVVRGYLAGSAWKEYQSLGTVAGLMMPKGLQLADRLPQPIFTPAIKAASGHDENISFDVMTEMVGSPCAETLRQYSFDLYQRGCDVALPRGILLADTKFEFGTTFTGTYMLIDEALTPDSSRYWLADQWRVGTQPPSLDKQYLRDYLEQQTDWNKQEPAPFLPDSIIEGVRSRYVDLANKLGVNF